MRISRICGGSDWAAAFARRRRLERLDDLRLRLGLRQFARGLFRVASDVRSSTRNVTSASSCTGPGSGGASATSGPPFTSLSGLNGGTASANPVGVIVRVVSRRVKGRAFTTSLSPTLIVVGTLKVCLSETMSTGRRSRSPLPGLTPSSCASAGRRGGRRIPAPRRNHIGCRDRDRARRRSGPRRRARSTPRRQAIGAMRGAARCGRADRRPVESAARRRGRGRPSTRSPREPRRGKAAANVVKASRFARSCRLFARRSAELVSAATCTPQADARRNVGRAVLGKRGRSAAEPGFPERFLSVHRNVIIFSKNCLTAKSELAYIAVRTDGAAAFCGGSAIRQSMRTIEPPTC